MNACTCLCKGQTHHLETSNLFILELDLNIVYCVDILPMLCLSNNEYRFLYL